MRVRYRESDVSLLGRLMRSEAQGEGNFGMKLVGNVVINRAVAQCSPFRKLNTIESVIMQKNAFEGTKTPLFQAGATTLERRLAQDCIKFWRANPAYAALYFQAPGKGKPCKTRFWGKLEGRYKNHCFYSSDSDEDCGL